MSAQFIQTGKHITASRLLDAYQINRSHVSLSGCVCVCMCAPAHRKTQQIQSMHNGVVVRAVFFVKVMVPADAADGRICFDQLDVCARMCS